VYYYEAVVRPVLEYARPVWHASLTADQTKTLEAVQRRACQIITCGSTYTENCALKVMSSNCPFNIRLFVANLILNTEQVTTNLCDYYN